MMSGTPRLPRSADAPLVQLFEQRAMVQPHVVAYDVFPTGARVSAARITWGELHRDSRAFAARLMIAGVDKSDRVVIHAGNRPLWPVADLALQMIGAIGVGIFPSSAPAGIRAILDDAAPVLALVDTPEAYATMCDARRELAASLQITGVSSDDGASQDWTVWRDEGARALATSPGADDALRRRTASVGLDDIAALIYTSGSTGEPKGAMISHRYLAASAQSIAMVLELDATDSSLSFLPFSHAAERVFGQCTRIHAGMSSALVEDPADLFAVAAAFEPTLFGGLPRIFERLYEAAELARAGGHDPRAAVAQRIGTRVRVATSGGAALPTGIAQYLEVLGLSVLGAYGQTEHLCIAMNRRESADSTSVGLPMPGTEIRIAPDGEVQVRRSALTFSGYLNKPDATAEAFTPDGEWLRTGDEGELDDAGRLHITGRLKELIALSTGRKIAPTPIESGLAASPLIAHAVCHGEGRKYLVVLLSLRRAVVEAWALREGIGEPWPSLAQHPRLREQLQDAVDRVNAGLARTDQIKEFAVTESEFTWETGELTPTLKLMRGPVSSRYAGLFNRLHSQ